MSSESSQDRAAGAWNPGIKSSLPARFLPLSTIFRPENVFTDIDTANELSGFTGLPLQKLVRFRPQRLVVHELLIRVSADMFVSDGSKYEDLGLNFREVVATILRDYIEPHMGEIVECYEDLRRQSESLAAERFDAELFAPAASPAAASEKGGFSLAKLFARKPVKRKAAAAETLEQRQQRVLDEWKRKAQAGEDELSSEVYSAMAYLGNALVIRSGRIAGDRDLLASLVGGLVCNRYGSEKIGEMIAPFVLEAAEKEGYRLLPSQAEPVVINVKGASAAGKSTMRPMQQDHIRKLGLNWEDFALISPDIWRKYLLDYDTLGEAYRYAGTLTGDEIPIVDAKFDRYMADKAAEGRISHLLIDRFRFDSFAPGPNAQRGSNLLTRFGHTVYLIFMVTPPPATVERAWLRGLQVGRFKSVDDLLDHNIEAFTGIPVLFFTWALRKDKTVYHEFLDNSVAHKEKPKTIAFGLAGEMYVIDFKCMLDIVRYTKINIDADKPDDVYPGEADMAPEKNTGFLADCAAKLEKIHFVERASGLVYASMQAGRMQWVDRDRLLRVAEDAEARAALTAMAPKLLDDLDGVEQRNAIPVPEEALRHTLGDLAR